MIYTNEEIFQIRYNTNLNRLQIGNVNWTSRLKKKIGKHKFLTTVVITLAMFASINVIMIYNFMKILQNV